MNDNSNSRVEWTTKPTKQYFCEETKRIIRHLQKAMLDIIDMNLPQQDLKDIIADYFNTLLEAGPQYVDYLEGKVTSQLQFKDSQRPVHDDCTYVLRSEPDRSGRSRSLEQEPPPQDRTYIQRPQSSRSVSQAPSPEPSHVSEQSLDTSEFLNLPPPGQGVRRLRRFRPRPVQPPAECPRSSFDESALEPFAGPSTSTPKKQSSFAAPSYENGVPPPKVTQKLPHKTVRFANCCPPRFAVPTQPSQPVRRGTRVRRILFPEEDHSNCYEPSIGQRSRDESALSGVVPGECTFDERPPESENIFQEFEELERRNQSQQRLIQYMNEYHNYLVEKYSTPPQRQDIQLPRTEAEIRTSKITTRQKPHEMTEVRDARQVSEEFRHPQPREMSDIRQPSGAEPQPRSQSYESCMAQTESEMRASKMTTGQQPAGSANATGADEREPCDCSLSRFEIFLRKARSEAGLKEDSATEQGSVENGGRFQPLRETESDSSDSAAEEEFLQAMLRLNWPKREE